MTAESLDVAEFIVGYLAEVDEHLASARACLTTLDASLHKNETNPKAVRDLFRALHTIKGLSAMVGAEPIVSISHELETLLRGADRSGGTLPHKAVDEIVRGLRAIEERVGNLSRKEPLAPAPQALLDALAALQLGAAPPLQTGTLLLEPEIIAKLTPAEKEQLLQGVAKGRRVLRADFSPSQERSARGLNITSVRTQIATLGELVKVLPRTVRNADGSPGNVAFVLLLITEADNARIAGITDSDPGSIIAIASGGPAPVARTVVVEELTDDEPAQHRNIVRVEVARLDDALEVLSTLMVTRSRMQRAVTALARGEGGVREVSAILAENGRQLRDLRAAIMRARMVPVAEMLERTPLLVRGLSRSSGKSVNLHVSAGRTELDKSVADRLSPAIVHLLRNAVDHALEPAAERVRLGKPPEGRIDISCVASSGSQLTLVISDDGRGIDAVRVARRANAPVPNGPAELLALITRPGLSTMETATHTSGRGVGMDIVKRIVVDELGGQLELHTELSRGTKFTLTVPLSVTILDAFTFTSANRTFVVPVSMVEDLIEVEGQSVITSPNPSASASSVRMLKHRQETLPFYSLSALLGFPGPTAIRSKAIVVRKNDKRFAFEVDSMLSQHEIVVRPLTDALVTVRGISGSTDLGDGKPTLVVDLLELADSVSLAPGASA